MSGLPPAISVAQARAIDQAAVAHLGMPSILLMENAARGVAEHARCLGDCWVVLCGPGNNGGDGLAAVRHLGRGARAFLLSRPDAARAPDAALQLAILERAGIEIVAGVPPPATAAVWIDALFGTGLERPLTGEAREWVEVFNRARGPKLAVDIPSGLHGDSGEVLGAACRCDLTVTFEAPKHGLLAAQAKPYVGRIEVVALGIPAAPRPVERSGDSGTGS